MFDMIIMIAPCYRCHSSRDLPFWILCYKSAPAAYTHTNKYTYTYIDTCTWACKLMNFAFEIRRESNPRGANLSNLIRSSTLTTRPTVYIRLVPKVPITCDGNPWYRRFPSHVMGTCRRRIPRCPQMSRWTHRPSSLQWKDTALCMSGRPRRLRNRAWLSRISGLSVVRVWKKRGHVDE